MRPNIEWRGVPFFTGIFTTIIQFLAGVGGLFLDIFFQKSRLDRKTTNATKAVTQTFSHVLRAAYFASLSGMGDLNFKMWAPALVLAVIGALGAPYVLERMTDDSFRQWTRVLIFTIATIYLFTAAWLFWRAAGGAGVATVMTGVTMQLRCRTLGRRVPGRARRVSGTSIELPAPCCDF